jgi:hypothetical protein
VRVHVTTRPEPTRTFTRYLAHDNIEIELYVEDELLDSSWRVTIRRRCIPLGSGYKADTGLHLPDDTA